MNSNKHLLASNMAITLGLFVAAGAAAGRRRYTVEQKLAVLAEYLYQTLGLIRLPLMPQRLPWANA